MAKTGLIIMLVIVTIIIVGGIVLLSMNKQGTSGDNTDNSGDVGDNVGGDTGNTGDDTGTGGNIEIPQTYNINIENFAFNPATLTIKAGDKVVWTNRDSTRHTVTSDSGSELDSELLGDGESYEHTFNTAGTYEYRCTLHPNMKAKVIVE